jgi:hypothetical protein
VLNRCGARTVIARETAETLADHDPPCSPPPSASASPSPTPRRPAAGLRTRTATRPAAREIAALAAEIEASRIGRRAMTRPPPSAASHRGPPIPISWIKAPTRRAREDALPTRFTARLTIDVTPELRGRIKIAAFRRGVTVADMLRELLAREFPPTEGDHHDRQRGSPRARRPAAVVAADASPMSN